MSSYPLGQYFLAIFSRDKEQTCLTTLFLMTTLSIVMSHFHSWHCLFVYLNPSFTCHFPQNIHCYSVSEYQLTALLMSIACLLCLLLFYSIYLSFLSTFFGHNLVIKKKSSWGFCGGPVVKTPCFYRRGHSLDSWSGNQDLACYAAQPNKLTN